MPQILLYDHRSSICSQMARLALVEKGLEFDRRQIDIMKTSEQFEPWYISLNPRAVVPTLQIDQDIVTDTINIVNRVQTFDGPDLSGGANTQDWLREIMALHYGVLLYRNRLDSDGTAPQIVARGKFLQDLLGARPELEVLIAARLDGNRRFQALLKDPEGIESHIGSAKTLVQRFIEALAQHAFISGSHYSLADCFATAALARFHTHGFSDWWRGSPVEDYYARMKQRRSFSEAEVIDEGTERDL